MTLLGACLQYDSIFGMVPFFFCLWFECVNSHFKLNCAPPKNESGVNRLWFPALCQKRKLGGGGLFSLRVDLSTSASTVHRKLV